VAWGFAEVLPDKVTILAETAELAEDIDVPRAEAARKRALEHIKTAEDTAAYEEAAQALARAEARLAVAHEKESSHL
jgi:F-type H+-transporting ATPase subunit epsilon